MLDRTRPIHTLNSLPAEQAAELAAASRPIPSWRFTEIPGRIRCGNDPDWGKLSRRVAWLASQQPRTLVPRQRQKVTRPASGLFRGFWIGIAIEAAAVAMVIAIVLLRGIY